MEFWENPSITDAAVAAATSPSSLTPISSFSSLPPRAVSLSPCAACKILRRRCVDKCVLAPYFPPSDPLKFTVAHRVFGASNIIKLLQELPEAQREDAVNGMVYEANARLRDPVYGCAGVICQLQKQISELQAELAKSQAEILNMQFQENSPQYQQDKDSRFFLDENFLGMGVDGRLTLLLSIFLFFVVFIYSLSYIL